MSLINQVLKDLDARDPAREPQTNTSSAAAVATPAHRTDWVRLFVWSILGFLVAAFLVYLYFVEQRLPEAREYQPVTANLDAARQPIKPAMVEPVVESVSEPESDQVRQVSQASAAMKQSTPTVVAEIKDVQVDAVSENSSHIQQPSPATSPTAKAEVVYLPLKNTLPPVVKEKPMEQRQSPMPSQISVTPVAKPTLEVARELMAEGRLTEAESMLRILTSKRRGDIAARELLLGLLLRNQRWQEAQKMIGEGLRLHPGRENLVLMQAQVRVSLQDMTGAIDVLERQLETGQAGRNTLAMLAPLYQHEARFSESASLYRKLVKQAPVEPSHWLGLAVSLDALAQSSQAVIAYRQALSGGGLASELRQYASQRIDQLQPPVASSGQGATYE